MLRDQRGPVLRFGFLDVDVDQAVPGGVQVGTEREHGSFIGHIGVLSLEVVHKFDPGQQTCGTGGRQLQVVHLRPDQCSRNFQPLMSASLGTCHGPISDFV